MEVNMYFPYLRGRQFELIALRELLQHKLIGEHIYPIVEPVKLSSTIIKTVELYQKENRNIGIIMNPCVGNLNNEKLKNNEDKICKNLQKLINNNNIKEAYHLSKNLNTFTDDLSNIILIAKNRDASVFYNNFYSPTLQPSYTLMLDESDFRRNIRNRTRVLLADNFNKQSKNANYNGDEFFTRDHLFYDSDGYVGFSDFSIVGDEYKESGFAPYAVAIHIVYLDKNQEMRVKHFVSDTNDDYTDTVKKFKEALDKLVAWNRDMQLDTYGMKEFERLHREESYPGLGTVKKLSIMHHIELVNNFLENRENG